MRALRTVLQVVWTLLAFGLIKSNVNDVSQIALSTGAVSLEPHFVHIPETNVYAEATSSEVPVSKVSVIIVMPSEFSVYNQADPINLYVTTSVTPVSGTVHLQLTCYNASSSPAIYPLQAEINVATSFVPSPYAYGHCTLNVDDNDPIFKSSVPQQVRFNIVYELIFNTAPSVIYLNQTFGVFIYTSNGVPSSLLSNLYLFCNTSLSYTWENVSFNTLVSLQVPDSLVPSQSCLFQTDGNPYFVETTSPVKLSTLTLEFAQPTLLSYVQPGITIPVNFTSNNITDPSGYATVSLSCLSSSFLYQGNLALNELYAIGVPVNVYGSCSLSVTSDIYIPPVPVALTISVQLSFVDPPSLIYEGQLFDIEIGSTGNPDANLTADLTLICPNANVYTWIDVALNETVTLEAPVNFPESDACYFSTVPAPYLAQPTNSSVTVLNVPLVFVQPTEASFTQNQLITIQVNATDFPQVQSDIDVTWACASENYSTDITMTINLPKKVSIPTYAFGDCSLSVNNPPAGFNSPAIVNFTVDWQLSLSNYPNTIYPSQTFSILISPALSSFLATSTNLSLCCPSSPVQTWTNVPFNTSVELLLSPSVSAYSNCYFKTETNTAYIIEAISSTIIVGSIGLVFEEPVANSTTLIPTGFPLLVTTPTNTSIAYETTANLYCYTPDISLRGIPFTTNIESIANYTSGLYGKCALSIPSLLPYFAGPVPVNFYLKFQLQFAIVPQTIYPAQPFVIEVSTSGQFPQNFTTIGLNLSCQGITIDTWPTITLSESQTLTVNYSGPETLASCSFQTVANGDIFVAVSSPVTIFAVSGSPFGGDLYPISPEEIIQFTNSLPIISTWTELTYVDA